jgi:hypothetical protein
MFSVFDVQRERVHAADSGSRRASSGPVCADPSWCRFLLTRRRRVCERSCKFFAQPARRVRSTR